MSARLGNPVSESCRAWNSSSEVRSRTNSIERARPLPRRKINALSISVNAMPATSNNNAQPLARSPCPPPLPAATRVQPSSKFTVATLAPVAGWPLRYTREEVAEP
jgi:hypothetical protein